MPLPLLLAVPALIAAAGAGAKKANDGRVALNDAKDIHEAAMAKYEMAKEKLERADKGRLRQEQALGDARRRVFDETIPEFISMVSRLRNAENVAEAAKGAFEADDVPLGEIRDIAIKQLEVLGSAASGVLAGGGAATAATGAVGAVGVASTGTAIGTLGGAAATNATLAWFGGGALAAGGGGMAAGAMVVGGIVAAPAILVGGIVFSKKMDQKVEEAKENALEVDEYVAKARAQGLLLESVSNSCQRGSKLLMSGCDELEKLTSKMNALADSESDVQAWDDQGKAMLKASGNLAGLLVGAASVPHVTENGRVNKAFLRAVDKLNA